MNNRYVVPMGSLVDSSYLNLTVKSAVDNELIGTNRKRYVDLRSGLWNVSLGYNKELYKEVSEAFSNIFSLGIPYLDIHSYNHPIYNEYAIKLLTFMNDKMERKFSRVFYTNSGSEGTELSVKIIDHLVSNNKNRILAFKEGYHGTFFAGMSVSGIDQKITSDYRLPSGVSFVDCPNDSIKMEKIKLLIENQSENIGAFFIEPVIGSSGTIIMNKDYIEEIISICKKNNILVIFDEVATGFYRTGKRFYYSDLIESPDIVILSKGINNGILPFGAVVINEKVEKILDKVHIEHFSTQNGNILGITSAVKSLEYYVAYEDKIVENISEINSIITEILNNAEINYRVLGTMLSIPINNSSKTIQLVHQLANMGILVYHYDNTKGDSGLTIFPSFLTDIKMLRKVLNIIAKKVVN